MFSANFMQTPDKETPDLKMNATVYRCSFEISLFCGLKEHSFIAICSVLLFRNHVIFLFKNGASNISKICLKFTFSWSFFALISITS